MKSKTLQKLADVISTLTTRQVGHTTLMKKGIDSYDHPFGVITQSVASSKEIIGENPNGSAYTISTLDNMRGTKMPVIFDNHALAKFLGDVHWELEKSSKSSDDAKKNQKVIMEFFEDYQNMAIDAEYVLMDYIETSWWHFSKRSSQMAKYIWLSNKRVALFQELLMKIKPSKIDEMLDN